jgi:serine protease Do
MEPGDSGGPLFDCLGRVIGLHSAIEIPEANNYDVPVDLYKKYFTALKSPKVYDNYPVMEDTFPADSLAAALVSLPGLVNTNGLNVAKAKYSNTCVIINSNIQGKPQKLNGTLFTINTQGIHQCLVVSKSSLVGDLPQLTCADGKKVKATVKARDRENDLVLLEPAAEIKGGISYTQLMAAKTAEVHAGVFLVSAQPDTAGIISVSGSEVFKLRKMSSLGFLGIGFKSLSAPLKVSYIFPNLNQSIYQIKIGDEILSVNNTTLNSFNDFSKALERFWPGDTVSLQLRRLDTTFTKNII